MSQRSRVRLALVVGFIKQLPCRREGRATEELQGCREVQEKAERGALAQL